MDRAARGESEYVRVGKGQVYGIVVLLGALLMALIAVTLLFVVRPSLLLEGLPQCTSTAVVPDLTAVWVANRARLLSQPPIRSIAAGSGFLFLVGATELLTGDADTTVPFRQQSDFLYVSGARFQPDCFIYIDPATANTTFFLGYTNPVVSGHTYPMSYWAQQLGVTQALPATELQAFLAQQPAGSVMYTLAGSAIDPNWWSGVVDTVVLQQALNTSRAIKTAPEIALLTYASAVSSDAQLQLMRKTCSTPLGSGSEYAVQASFYQSLFACDLEVTGYEPIMASGYNSAVLHYIANTDTFACNELLLVDAAGAKYTSDITRTFPVNGRFTAIQAGIYQAVLDAQLAAAAVCKSGVAYSALSAASANSLTQSLQNLGLVTLPLPSAALRLFMPHGLSHSVGLDVHDDPALPSVLQSGVVLTIEPGIYFNSALFTAANFALYPQLNQPAIMQYLNSGFGGVRIEDVYVVQDNGCMAISTAPKTIADIEFVCRGN